MKCLVSPLALFAALGLQTVSAPAALLTYWNFNNVSPAYNSGTGALGSFATSDNGSGEIYTTATRHLSANSSLGVGAVFTNSSIDFNGLNYVSATFPTIVNGVSSFGRQTTSTGAGGFATFIGSALNGVSGEVAGDSLVVWNAKNWENSKSLTLTLSSAGYDVDALSFALRYNAAGTRSGTLTWAYSTDNVNFTTAGTVAMAGNSGVFTSQTIGLSTFDALDNQSTFYLRMTLTAPADPNNVAWIAFDNMQVTGTAVPEPSPGALAALFGSGCLMFRRTRK